MSYRHDLWEIAAEQHGVVTITEAEDAGVPAVEVRKLAHRGALQAYGKGVYIGIRSVPTTDLTEPAAAVALAGDGAFLERETVLDLLGLGQFNPLRIRVATRRRVRRALPEWVDLRGRKTDVSDEDLTITKASPRPLFFALSSTCVDRTPTGAVEDAGRTGMSARDDRQPRRRGIRTGQQGVG